MTEMCFHEIAAAVTTSVVSGASIEFGGVAKAVSVDHFTPMEPRFASEVAHAAAGMTRQDANRLVAALLDRYEDRLDNAPAGAAYDECWDLDRIVPTDEYEAFYERMKREIGAMGIPFPAA
jgi:methylamine--corrinoid protein Co-methyltransferase